MREGRAARWRERRRQRMPGRGGESRMAVFSGQDTPQGSKKAEKLPHCPWGDRGGDPLREGRGSRGLRETQTTNSGIRWVGSNFTFSRETIPQGPKKAAKTPHCPWDEILSDRVSGQRLSLSVDIYTFCISPIPKRMDFMKWDLEGQKYSLRSFEKAFDECQSSLHRREPLPQNSGE